MRDFYNKVKNINIKSLLIAAGVSASAVALLIVICVSLLNNDDNSNANEAKSESTSIEVAVYNDKETTTIGKNNNEVENFKDYETESENETTRAYSNIEEENKVETVNTEEAENRVETVNTEKTVNKDKTESYNESDSEEIYSTTTVPEVKTSNIVKGYCNISIDCLNILNDMSEFDTSLTEYLPADGFFLHNTRVEVYENDTVFDILDRVSKSNNILLQYSFTTEYGSAYIESINNIGEFDCGQLSGWMFSVNDVYPNVGCSLVNVDNGDVIKWRYTCNLGGDVGADVYQYSVE